MLLLDIHKPSLSSAGILPAYLPLAPCFYTSYSLLLAGVLKKIKFIYKMNTFIHKPSRQVGSESKVFWLLLVLAITPSIQPESGQIQHPPHKNGTRSADWNVSMVDIDL